MWQKVDECTDIHISTFIHFLPGVLDLSRDAPFQIIQFFKTVPEM